MCGINGVFSLNADAKELQKAVLKMNKSTVHRGPDNSNLEIINNNLCLGHNRLSIIDTTNNGNQPFTKDGFTLVFNGEIYNYRELAKYIPSDREMVSTSDTEVLLELWRIKGPECLSLLRGMYAFAIYDSSRQKLFLVRDPFGIKPLFYYQTASTFVFSSELKAIEQIVSENLTISKSGVLSSTAFTWIPENRCIYEQVKKLPGGHYITVDVNGDIHLHQFYAMRELIDSQPKIKSESEAVSYLNDVLCESVKQHLVADVPINAFLSGGLDSSLIVAMAKHHGCLPDCYTIKFSDKEYQAEGIASDVFYAKKVADHLGVKLNTIEAKPNMVELLPKIVEHLDEPIGDAAAISTFLICDAARKQGVKVLLSGMGADEMLSGYRKHYANKFAFNYSRVPSPLRNINKSIINALPMTIGGRNIKLVRWAKRFQQIAEKPFTEAFLRSYTYCDLPELVNHMPSLSSENIPMVTEYHDQFLELGLEKRDLVDAMCFTDINNFMVSLNEVYTDRASMAASTEVRVPFIDKEFVKAAFNISSQLKLRGREQKYILKKVAEKWLPHHIIYRPKSGFAMPLKSWISGELSEMVSEYLLSSKGLVGREVVEESFANELIATERSGQKDNSRLIWQLLTLEQWFRNKGVTGKVF